MQTWWRQDPVTKRIVELAIRTDNAQEELYLTAIWKILTDKTIGQIIVDTEDEDFPRVYFSSNHPDNPKNP